MLFGGKFSKVERNLIQDTHLHSGMLSSRFLNDCYRMWIAQNKIPKYFEGRDDEWDQFVSAQSNGIDIYDCTRGNISDISEQQWKDFIYYFKFFVLHSDYIINNQPGRLGNDGVFEMKKLHKDAEQSINILLEKYKKCHKGNSIDVKVSPYDGIENPFYSYIEQTKELPFYELRITDILLGDWERISPKLDVQIKSIARVSEPPAVKEYSVDGAYDWCDRVKDATMKDLAFTLASDGKDNKWASNNQYLELIKYYYDKGQNSLWRNRRQGQFLSWEYGNLTLHELTSIICTFEYQKCALENSPLRKDQASYIKSMGSALEVFESIYYEIGL